MLHAPAAVTHCVVFVPPFAEEMNKCRRQVAETARSLAANGRAVLVPDVFGTGDSDGEFSDATWDIWKHDIASAISWAESEVLAVDGIIATRLGCALAAESLFESGKSVARTVFWQPVAGGRQFMTQFLRLRVAASMMEPDGQETVEALRKRLQSGSTLEVAGYELTPELFRSIEQVQLQSSLHRGLGELRVIEVGRAKNGSLSAIGQRLMAAAEESGIVVTGQRIPGDPIWAATEIVTNALLEKTTVDHLVQREQ